MKEHTELYHVSIDAIRDYDLTGPIDLVYIAMWEEELMPFFDINIDNIASKISDYGKCVLEGLREWKEMKEKREKFQKKAIVKLKLLGYVSMVAKSFGCILTKQYKQISMQIAEAINLIASWKKSDAESKRLKDEVFPFD